MPIFFEPVRATFTVYPKDKRKFDIDNIGCVVAKMFLDCVVQSGRLEDDNYEFVPEIVFKFGEVSKNNPRCDIKIEEIYGNYIQSNTE